MVHVMDNYYFDADSNCYTALEDTLKKEITSQRKRWKWMIKYCPDLTGFEIKEGGDK